MGARLPRVSADFPPPLSVARLECPRCETFVRLTDRTIREAYGDPDSICFCLRCYNEAGELVYLELRAVRPIAREVRELRELLAKLDRVQGDTADHEAVIVFKRRQALRAELEALAVYVAQANEAPHG